MQPHGSGSVSSHGEQPHDEQPYDEAPHGEAPYDEQPYDDLPDGVLVVGSEGAVTDLNRAGARLLGITRDQAVGRDYRQVLPLLDAAGRDWWACSRPLDGLSTRRGQTEQPLTLAGSGGDERVLLVTASYVRERPAGPVVRLVVAFRDDAARVRHERSRADLVSTVAHELRSPLTSVKGFTATLLARWDRFTDEQKQHMLRTVNADADRVTRLLTELLDVSRIDAGRLEVRRQVVDVAAAAQRIIDGLVAAGQEPERFRLTVTGTPPPMWLDPDKLAQILGNLAENGLRHGDGTITVSVRARAAGDGLAGAGVEVVVSDEGEGIAEEVLPRVFTRFWRGGRRTGTGLGLYIVKGLVEAHGGTVQAGRAPGGGAQFRVLLPAGQAPYEL